MVLDVASSSLVTHPSVDAGQRPTTARAGATRRPSRPRSDWWADRPPGQGGADPRPSPGREDGLGERTFTLIGRASGGLNPGALSRSLDILTSKRLVEAHLPLSTQPSKDTRYYVADPHLRFWLSFISPGMPAIERGRGDQVLTVMRQKWTSWRGRAIEPLVRQSLLRLPPGTLPSGTDAVGGYWTRTNDPEIDLVGADRAPIAKKVTMAGSIKWLENKPFDGRDLARLVIHRSRLPGADDTTPLLAVSRTGTTTSGVTILMPDDLLAAWEPS